LAHLSQPHFKTHKGGYKVIYYHFTSSTLRDGRHIPAIGEWLVFDGVPKPCTSGLHASPTPWDALQYAPGNLLHKVQLDGLIVPHGSPINKFAAQKRIIVATIDAEQLMRDFARQQALSVIHLWTAPDIVRQYLETGDPGLRAAARAAALAAALAASTRTAAWAAAWAASGAAALAAALAAASGAAAARAAAARAAALAAARAAAARAAALAAAWAASGAAARAAFNSAVDTAFGKAMKEVTK
jgi:hypothetical protein